MAKDRLPSVRPSRSEAFARRVSGMVAGIKAIDSGDLPELKKLLQKNPDLVRCRAEGQIEGKNYEDGYFAAATLLHHVAGNPVRGPLPENVIEVTKTLLDAGADVDATTSNGDWSWRTLGLVASGLQAEKQGFTEAPIDVLLAAGADINFGNGMNMYAALLHTQEWQNQRKVAQMLYDRGAKVDLCFAAALGDLEAVRRGSSGKMGR